jgi:hypothetical protein
MWFEPLAFKSMPWTFAHPAAILPFRRLCPLRLNFAALIVGSMTPDLGYYIQAYPLATIAHTFLGSLLVCLPTGIGLLVLVYSLRTPMWFVLPQPHRRALMPLFSIPVPTQPLSILGVAISLLIGAWTHLIWDSFTHESGWAVINFAVLRRPLFQIGSVAFPTYYLLQHLSTWAGIALLTTTYYLWLQRTGPLSWCAREDRWRYVLFGSVLLVALSIALPLAMAGASELHGFFALRVLVFRAAVYATAVFIPLFTLCAIVAYSGRG